MGMLNGRRPQDAATVEGRPGRVVERTCPAPSVGNTGASRDARSAEQCTLTAASLNATFGVRVGHTFGLHPLLMDLLRIGVFGHRQSHRDR